MSFDWEQYLIHARELSDPTATKCQCLESLYRSCISRAYYSVFIRVRNKLQDHFDQDYPRNGVHAAVRRDLKRLGKIELENLLSQMSKSRNKADYDNCVSRLSYTAKDQLIKAELVKKLLDTI